MGHLVVLAVQVVRARLRTITAVTEVMEAIPPLMVAAAAVGLLAHLEPVKMVAMAHLAPAQVVVVVVVPMAAHHLLVHPLQVQALMVETAAMEPVEPEAVLGLPTRQLELEIPLPLVQMAAAAVAQAVAPVQAL